MATRMYLTRTSFSVINPGTLATWGSSVKSVQKMDSTNPVDSAFLISTYTGYGAGTVLFRQYISRPMAAGVIFNGATTYEMVMRSSESSTAANAYQQWSLGIVDSTGATSYFTPLTTKDGTEFGTALAGRSNTYTGGITYTTVLGDRLVLEVGWDQDASGSYAVSHSVGNTSTDLTGEGDTGVQNPWFEFGNTITFTAEGAVPSTNEDWDVSAYISGVLDEWA